MSVFTRHGADCPHKDKGKDHRKCACPKWLYIYEGGGGNAHRKVSAKTRSWEKAEKRAQEIRDSWDPEKQELKRLRAEKQQQVTVEEAVALFLADQVARLGEGGTVQMSRSLLGHGRHT